MPAPGTVLLDGHSYTIVHAETEDVRDWSQEFCHAGARLRARGMRSRFWAGAQGVCTGLGGHVLTALRWKDHAAVLTTLLLGSPTRAGADPDEHRPVAEGHLRYDGKNVQVEILRPS